MKQFIRNSLLILSPYVLVAIICGLFFGHFLIFLLLALLVFITGQLIQQYHLKKWSVDQSISPPSLGLNRLWKNIYFLLETQLNSKPEVSELPVAELRDNTKGNYGLVLLKDNQIDWLNQPAGTLLKLDATRDLGVDIEHSLREPRFLDALTEKHYGQEIVLDTWHPPIAICLLPYGPHYLCMLVRDISHHVAIKNTNRELVANVAHELRSPLTVIQGYLEILTDLGDKAEDQDLAKMLDHIQTQVIRMKVLVDDVLNIAYLENTELKEHEQSRVDVPEMLESILKSFTTDTKKYHFLKQIENFDLHGNASELQSVFHNVINNAICHSQSEQIKVVWRRDEQGAYFEVIDRGIGIAAQHLPKLSKRFYRVDAARSGSEGNRGLGLAVVKHVLNRHQATLEIESEVGQGSTFRCCFPLARIES